MTGRIAASTDAVSRLVQLAARREGRGDYVTTHAAAEAALELLDALGPASVGPAAVRLRLHAQGHLGNSHRHFARYAEAEAILASVLASALALLGETDTETAAARNNLGVLYKYLGRFDEAEGLYRAALASLPPDEPHPLTATLYHNLGGLEHARGRFAAGEPHARQAWELNRRRLGETHPTTLADAAAYAGLLHGLERYAESEPIYRRVLAEFEKIYGPEHFEVAVNVHNLAGVYFAQGAAAEAETHYRRALHLKEKLLGPEHPDTALTVNNLGVALAAQGQPADANRCFERALASFQNHLGPAHPLTRLAEDNLRVCSVPLPSSGTPSPGSDLSPPTPDGRQF